MNRIPFAASALLSSLAPLLFDSALKGVALLAAAALCTLALARASAAARHLVWLIAVALLLVLPALSVALPQWRVLPRWVASVLPDTSSATLRAREASRAIAAVTTRTNAANPSSFHGGESSVEPESQSGVEPLVARSMSKAPALAPGESPHPWKPWLPFAWAAGSVVLVGRLLAAHLLLLRTAHNSVVLTPDANPAASAVTAAFAAACEQLGIRQRVILLLDEKRTIPVVWGILHPRLLLPAEALAWNQEQLRSVLLHELAHLRRRDPLAQWLAQIACALYWFNPLVWVAAWRLHVERERACDDLVLASGVRASAYAAHLLHVATHLSAARWTMACGLAMARKSSLEGRLIAVLSEKLNRRTVTGALAVAALLFGAAIAIPIAMLRAAEPVTQDQEAAKRPTEPNAGRPPQEHGQPVQPKHEYAKSLFQKWQANARADGRIPGALIGDVAREVDNFLEQSPKDEKAPKLAALRPRFETNHDWDPADAVALLDELTAISTAPVSWADLQMEFSAMQTIQGGKPLPVELESAAWGQPAANGLRAAWLLEPRGERYALGTVLKARVLFHNTGLEPLILKTETWHQGDPHTARDAQGGEIKVSGTWYSGITPMATFRLAPGEYAEVRGHGIAIGAGEYTEEHSTGSVGAVIEAKEGDDVRFSSVVDASYGGWTRPGDPKDPTELWKTMARERVEREAPMPRDATDREQIIRRVTLDLIGEPPTPAEIAAFAADGTPDALAKLIERLVAKKRLEPFAGKLPTGEIKFHVIAADPKAAQTPRTATEPGRYVLGENVHLLVSQTTTDARRTNKAVIAFLSPDPKVASPFAAREIALPDGLRTYAIAWEPGAGVLWITQQGLVRSYNFTNPAQVQETRFEPGNIANVPEKFRDVLKAALNGPDAPEERHETQKPKPAAVSKPPDDALWNTKVPFEKIPVAIANWSAERKGLRIGMRLMAGDGWRIGGKVKVELWVHNMSAEDLPFTVNPNRPDVGLVVRVSDSEGHDHFAENGNMNIIAIPLNGMLPAGQVAMVKEFALSFDAADNRETAWLEPKFRGLEPGKYKLRCTWSDADPLVAAVGEWTGELTTPEVDFTLLAQAAPVAKQPAPKAPEERAKLEIAADGALSFDGRNVTLEQLKAEAAKKPEHTVEIHAEKKVPYVKVVEAVNVLKAAGAADFFFREAQVGDGKFRVANRTGEYDLGDGRKLYLNCPAKAQPWLTVNSPATGPWPRSGWSLYTHVNEKEIGRLAVVWEPGAPVLWCTDGSEIEGLSLLRTSKPSTWIAHSRASDEVKDQFRLLGFVIGHDQTPRWKLFIDGNTGGLNTLSTEMQEEWGVAGRIADLEGRTPANVPMHELSVADGRFRTGMPVNRPLIVAANPGGSPSTASNSAGEAFTPTVRHEAQIILPKESGNGDLKIERLDVGINGHPKGTPPF